MGLNQEMIYPVVLQAGAGKKVEKADKKAEKKAEKKEEKKPAAAAPKKEAKKPKEEEEEDDDMVGVLSKTRLIPAPGSAVIEYRFVDR